MIPQKGHTDLTARLVSQIRRHEAAVAVLVVVGDDMARPAIPGASCVYSPRTPLTAAWNLGVSCSADGMVVLLNNDVECSGAFLDGLRPEAPLEIVGVRKRAERYCPDIRVLEGWCLAFDRELWAGLGGFDERMRLYYQDLDFQLRTLNAGGRLRKARVPLKHLGHRTAHDPEILPRDERRKTINRDRRIFRETHGL